MLRAMCGVAAGSSKASLSAHFAKWGNLGELNAVCHIFFAMFLEVRSISFDLYSSHPSKIRLSYS